jgi:hypothetical protein
LPTDESLEDLDAVDVDGDEPADEELDAPVGASEEIELDD